jgi:Ser/Thr protein kinase RdoA (MazF antagonist)
VRDRSLPVASGLIEQCPSQGCGYRCCEFQQGNFIVLHPGEVDAARAAGESLDHLRITPDGHGGHRAICAARDTATCDGGHKPLDCRSYPYFPAARAGADAVIRGAKCPLLVEETEEHLGWVVWEWRRLARRDPRVAAWLPTVEMVGYEPVTTPTMPTIRSATEAALGWVGSMPRVSAAGGWENQVFTVTTKSHHLYLRFTAAARRTRAEVDAEVAVAVAAAAAGAAQPVADLDGEMVVTLEVGGVPYHVVAFEPVTGPAPTAHELADQPDRLARWGQALARLHTAFATVDPEVSRARPVWWDDPLLGALREPTAGLSPVTHDEWAAIGASVDGLTGLPVALVHADFHGGNVRDAGTEVRCFDLDDSMRHVPGYDLAVLAYWVGEGDRAAAHRALAPILDGYCSGGGDPGVGADGLRTLLRLRRLLDVVQMELRGVDTMDAERRDRLATLRRHIERDLVAEAIR